MSVREDMRNAITVGKVSNVKNTRPDNRCGETSIVQKRCTEHSKGMKTTATSEK